MDASDEAKMQRMQENLAVIRKVAGWSSQRLADEIGVTRQTVSNLERGRTPLTKTQYIALRYVFNLEVASSENQALAKVITMLVDDPVEDSDEDVMEGTMRSLSATTSLLAADVDQDGEKTPLVRLAKAAVSPLATGMIAGAMTAMMPGAVLLAPVGLAIARRSADREGRGAKEPRESDEGGGLEEEK